MIVKQSLIIKNLQLNSFRNYEKLNLDITANKLLILGANGIGKSNLLESVELVGTLRSHRNKKDQDLIMWGKDNSSIKISIINGDDLDLKIRKKGGRLIYRNGKELKRQHDVLDSFRCVSFSNLDLNLIRGEPDSRRNWIDKLIMQVEPIYVELIQRFKKLLSQRNFLLKNINNYSLKERDDLLDLFDQQMSLISARIYKRRLRLVKRIYPVASQWHSRFSGGNENLKISFKSSIEFHDQCDENIIRNGINEQLHNQRKEELRLGFCTVGPHRDDIEFSLNQINAKRFSSAGQQRTLVLSLKLAELEIIKTITNYYPLLLLDDVLAELDQKRQRILLEAVGDTHQCFISATHLDTFYNDWAQSAQILKL